MEEKLNYIKEQLGSGSINIFGLPFSGKDTVGLRLAKDLGARFLSSGLIMRAAAEGDADLRLEMTQGLLASTEKFRQIVLSYFAREDLRDSALVLSSVGRWSGEEYDVMEAAREARHPIKVVILLNLSEAEVRSRWEVAKTLNDRGEREDDKDAVVLDKRIAEFIEKTMPVVSNYQSLGLLQSVNAHASKDEVYEATVNAIYSYFKQKED